MRLLPLLVAIAVRVVVLFVRLVAKSVMGLVALPCEVPSTTFTLDTHALQEDPFPA